jgi:hypothetical protein
MLSSLYTGDRERSWQKLWRDDNSILIPPILHILTSDGRLLLTVKDRKCVVAAERPCVVEILELDGNEDKAKQMSH